MKFTLWPYGGWGLRTQIGLSSERHPELHPGPFIKLRVYSAVGKAEGEAEDLILQLRQCYPKNETPKTELC
ncbi:MAG: hypothetical protein GTO14_18160 [Anaerolineales bacterium]|nr:hypothetical protein [Anaerolineales bacterium]